MRSIVIAALCLSCASVPRRGTHGSSVAGTLADVRTAPGSYNGYVVRRDCPPFVLVVSGVEGSFEPGALPTGGRIGVLGHLVARGDGITCDQRSGEVWFIDDFRVLDALVPSLARRVAGTAASVAIYVSGQPVNYATER